MIGLALLAAAALARSPAHDACMATGDAARGVTVAMQDCNAVEYDRQDTRLNRAYAALMRRLPPAGRKTLREDERRWIAIRAARCRRATRPLDGGTLASIVGGSCMIGETARRADMLEGRLR